MSATTRREFLDRLALGAAAVGALPLGLGALADPLHAMTPATTAADWNVTWVRQLTGKHRVVFDVPEVESGYGVWRASIWANQYHQVLGIPTRELSAAVVLRHNGIALAMKQEFWDRYGVGKAKNVLHPLTQEPTHLNPVLIADAPEPYASFALDKFLARGGTALACDLALRDCVQLIATKDGMSPEAARARALEMMVPGVILQPSGVFAVVRAQDAGCQYVRAS